MDQHFVVGYIRVSTDGQVGEDKYGIDAQKRDIIHYCEGHGLTILKWYIEEAVSGSTDLTGRPELTKILNRDITNPPIEAVVVAKNDRLARDIENFYGFKYLLKRNKIDLISVAEDFGEAGVYKPVYEAISAAFAQLERSFINMRTSGGRTIKAMQGGYAGGKPPYGYSAQPSSKKLTINPHEAEIVRLIYHLRDDEGYTMSEIRDELTARGYKNRSRKDFVVSGVQSILKNRQTYQGYYRYGPNAEWVKGQHEAILPAE